MYEHYPHQSEPEKAPPSLLRQIAEETKAVFLGLVGTRIRRFTDETGRKGTKITLEGIDVNIMDKHWWQKRKNKKKRINLKMKANFEEKVNGHFRNFNSLIFLSRLHPLISASLFNASERDLNFSW